MMSHLPKSGNPYKTHDGVDMKILRKIGMLFPVSLLCLVPAALPAQIGIGIAISVHTPPPVLPVYEQPPCPVEGYLWTPGYWGFNNGAYGWNEGYWGPQVGFYGGVNYGFGYGGVGFFGGMWAGNVFRYNTAVVNVDRTVIRNTYIDRTVIRNVTVSHASFNGPGGVDRRPTPEEEAAFHAHH